MSYNGEAAFTYRYDSAGNVTEKKDIEAGVTYYYSQDLIGRPTVMRTDHGQALQVSYDGMNRTSAVISEVKGAATETGFTYGDGSSRKPEGSITGVTVDGRRAAEYFYDSLGRLESKYVGIGDNGTDIQYTYQDISGTDRTSTRITSEYHDGVEVDYTYDSLGNIKSIRENGRVVKSYEYDKLGQLVRDNDAVEGITTTYTYDNGGNITWKRIYEYAPEGSEPNEGLYVLPFSYNNSWRDMLVTYKGRSITYDGIGNPLTYRDGMSFTWERGRRLATLNKTGVNASYTYDDNGIRTGKTVNGVKTDYYLNGSTILTQISGATRLDFFYDENGSVLGFKYGGGIYLYRKNICGDITGIENSENQQVCGYRYDAWGNILEITGEEAETLGKLNPFRYRGYYYDEESGLYYLNSRYYDPEVGRFVNADGYDVITAAPMELKYKNLFAYCDNNPVVRVDTDGAYWETIIDVISLAISVIDVANNPNDPWAWVGLVADVVCLVLPVVAGGGLVVKALTKTDDVVDVTRAVSKADDVADAVYTTGKLVDDIPVGYINACFVAGTFVLVETGHKAIEDISIGDMVWSENPETGQKELKKVVQTFINKTDELVYVSVNGENIITTPEHPFYVSNIGWIRAIQLRAGEVLLLQSGEYVIVEMVQHEILEFPITVYNFEVEDFHTYYVSNSAVLVHNACGKAFDNNQKALIELAKEAKRTGIDRVDADILWQWTEEYGLGKLRNYHPPKFDSYLGGTQLHIKINGMHINIFEHR